MFKIYRTCFWIICLFLFYAFVPTMTVLAQDAQDTQKYQRILHTRYTYIYYPDKEVLSKFFWRITGKKFKFTEDLMSAKSHIDRIVGRVQAILDMRPKNFRVKIELVPKYEGEDIALYSHKKGAITVYVDSITDFILAHELAHAIISKSFRTPPPEKAQEILTQYVDRHLWEDY